MKGKMFYASAGFGMCLLMAVAFGFGRMNTEMQTALAQSPGGSAGNTTVVLGELHRGAFPVVVVDSVDDSILLYEADISSTRWKLELKNARTFRYDKQIREFNTEPEISRVRQLLSRDQ